MESVGFNETFFIQLTNVIDVRREIDIKRCAVDDLGLKIAR